MAEARAAWGIDIGQSGLKAIKIRQLEAGGPVVAEAFDYIQFPKILSQPDAVPDEIVPQAMQTFLSRNDLKGDVVCISVPGQSALARFIQLPPVESSRLHEIVKYEAKQQIPFALEDVIWDYQPLGAGSEQGGFLLDAEVGLFAMKKDQVHQQLRPYNNAKVEVDLIQIAPLALYSVLSVDLLGIRRDEAGEPGDEYSIVLDMGCDNTTLMVSNGYKIWIRNVPIGGNHFTRALTKEMKLSFAKAEHLKCNATKSPDPRAVFQALRPVFNDYVSEIQRSIGFFSSVNRSAKVARVVGLGNGFKLAGLQKFLQQNLQYQVDRPETFQALTGDAVLNSPLFMENILSFAVPYGLALQGLGLSRMKTSLLPPEITTARLIRRKKPWALVTAASLLLCLAGARVADAVSYTKVQAPEFVDAENKAKEFSGEISTAEQNYAAQVANNARQRAVLDQYTAGLRSNLADIPHLEVLQSVLAAMPRDDKEFGLDELEKRNSISILRYTSNRVPDLAAWFSGIPENFRNMMAPNDKAVPPAGPGFVFTIQGETYRDNPMNPEDRGQMYVLEHFVKKLQQLTVPDPLGGPPRDVTRMGISHATLIKSSTSTVQLNLDTNRIQPPPRIDPRGRGGLRGAAGNPNLIPQAAPAGSLKQVKRTDFVIEFALRYVPRGQRPPLPAPAPPAAAPQPVPGA